MEMPRVIYAIKHNVTKRIYVGSTKYPKERFANHLSMLRNGKHIVEDMQKDFDEYGEDFTLSSLWIREPIGEVFDGEIHAVITPLLAVDERGNRLGYGGGYYDRFFKTHGQAKRIGYCFDFQIVKSVPNEEHDEKLQCIVTDKRIVYPHD